MLIGDEQGFKPCTPHGCMVLLEKSGIDPSGKHAVIIGSSNIVGKPMSYELLNAGATVTLCNELTQDLASHIHGHCSSLYFICICT